MSDESMQQQLVAWVASKALCTTIREYQMGPIPRLPYISIHYVQSKQIRDWPRHFVYEDADQEVPPRIWAGPVLEVE
jgi:hypothetical protein